MNKEKCIIELISHMNEGGDAAHHMRSSFPKMLGEQLSGSDNQLTSAALDLSWNWV